MAKRVLLIDDEEKLRGLMARIIGVNGEGFEVEQADSLKSARQKLGRSEFDVVVCDVKLPDGNGVDFIKEIAEKQPLAETILLTAYGNIPDGVQGGFTFFRCGNEKQGIIDYGSIREAKRHAVNHWQIKFIKRQVKTFRQIGSMDGKNNVPAARSVAPIEE